MSGEKNEVLNFLVGMKVLHISFYICGIKTGKVFKKRSKADAFIYNILMYKCFVGALYRAITDEEMLKEHY